ncbi:hypothetical protein Cgig2_031994 [Carnegiea gigantea]|uniref:Uncharacterized protein n=1 Tax=Carnegiea gigantea TaxID=171969 RepID=A0A9Q1GME8_9CARY|nr:hypothetical protein Cgig2_031994 [Carnegiea gigantea]
MTSKEVVICSKNSTCEFCTILIIVKCLSYLRLMRRLIFYGLDGFISIIFEVTLYGHINMLLKAVGIRKFFYDIGPPRLLILSYFTSANPKPNSFAPFMADHHGAAMFSVNTAFALVATHADLLPPASVDSELGDVPIMAHNDMPFFTSSAQ